MADNEIAILMAAGLGTRMRPLTDKIAKPLVNVHGKPLIETIIDALLQRGVTAIYVVVGYRKEQFNYLVEKYHNLELIENKEYLKKNNISSLYAVGDILGSRDCFICEADLYVTEPAILLREFARSCYFGKMIPGYSDDWVFEMQNGKITKVGKGGTDTYNMAGISYWKKEDAVLIRNAIREAYKTAGHEQLFWDEIVDQELDNLDVTVEEIPADSVVEIDTFDELCKIDETYRNAEYGRREMIVTDFIKQIKKMGIKTLTGVPDSALKPFCDYINGVGKEEFTHYVPANEGAAVGIALGEYLSTGVPACVYMQNSGLGNIVNPITSLAIEEVYGIPMLLLVGYRGEPGKKDEPQHKYMGKITESLLDVLGIEHMVLGKELTEQEISEGFGRAAQKLKEGQQFAFVLKKDFLEIEEKGVYVNDNSLIREDAIAQIIESLDESDVVVSTTGKISREVYEQSDRINGSHAQDFLTVGGMGHASMIAFGIAENAKEKRVYCLDGDGAELMHMGSLAFIAKQKPQNFVHICLNNEAHESVGGMPTGCVGLSYAEVARTVGYEAVYYIDTMEELKQVLHDIKPERKLTFIEIKVSMQSRADLGRPKETAAENKENFMKYHGVKE